MSRAGVWPGWRRELIGLCLTLLTCRLSCPAASLAAVHPQAVTSASVDSQPAWYPAVGASITHVLLHFDVSLAAALAPAWCDLLSTLDAEVRVTIACVEPRDAVVARDLAASCRGGGDNVDVICVGRELSLWPRDASLVLGGGGDADVVGLRGRGDPLRVGDLCASRLLTHRALSNRPSPLTANLDGGQLVFGVHRAFIGGRGLRTADAVAWGKQLAFWSPTGVSLVEAPLGAPHPHLDMFFAVADDKTVLVGEVSGDGATPVLRAQYDAIASALRARSFRVERLPIMHLGGDRVLTWTNVLTETRDTNIAYVPRYGVALDEQAHAVWRRCGFSVVPIDCARLVEWGGAVRCLTNVVRWREATPRRLSAALAAAEAGRTLRCDLHRADGGR